LKVLGSSLHAIAVLCIPRTGASGRAGPPCPPDSRARTSRLRRRRSCSLPPPALAARRPGAARWRRALARPRKWRWHGTSAACTVSCARRASPSAYEPDLWYPKPYGCIRRYQRDALLNERMTSRDADLRVAPLRGPEATFCAQRWKPLDTAFGTLRRGDRALPPTRPGLLQKEAGFVFSVGYEISGGDKPGDSNGVWPFRRR
jgi:hypothetical protein